MYDPKKCAFVWLPPSISLNVPAPQEVPSRFTVFRNKVLQSMARARAAHFSVVEPPVADNVDAWFSLSPAILFFFEQAVLHRDVGQPLLKGPASAQHSFTYGAGA